MVGRLTPPPPPQTPAVTLQGGSNRIVGTLSKDSCFCVLCVRDTGGDRGSDPIPKGKTQKQQRHLNHVSMLIAFFSILPQVSQICATVGDTVTV